MIKTTRKKLQTEQVIIQIWISFRFGVLSKQPPADEKFPFINLLLVTVERIVNGIFFWLAAMHLCYENG